MSAETGTCDANYDPEIVAPSLVRGTDDALSLFRDAAIRVKAAEAEMRAASQAYGEAIKRLSEEVTK